MEREKIHSSKRPAIGWLPLLYPYLSRPRPRPTPNPNHQRQLEVPKGECTAAADSAFDDSKWTSIHLPHTWNTDVYTEKDYYRGTAGIAGN